MKRLTGTISESYTFDEPASRVGTLSSRYIKKSGSTPTTSRECISTSFRPEASMVALNNERS